MIARDLEIDEIRQKIRDLVQQSQGSLAPIELIERLKEDRVNEDRVRGVMWYMLDHRELELTDNWKLRTGEHAIAAD